MDATGQRALQIDRELAQRRPSFRPFGESGRLTRQLSMDSFVAYHRLTDGVSQDEKRKLLQDCDRLYLGIHAQRTPVTPVNRLGRVSSRTVYGPDGRKQEVFRAR